MSESSPDSSTDDASNTLYDPSPSDSNSPSTDEDDTVTLTLSLPEERAQRLRRVAQQLGLNPAMIARRAIEMICDEVITIHDTYRPSHILIEEYQARIDLLHAVEDEDTDNPEVESPNAEETSTDE